MKLTGVFVLVIAVGLALGWLFRDGSAAEAAAMGEPAPDFTVQVITGGTFTLSESKGRPVVLNFWASWCAPCETEIPAISTFADDNPGVQVIGVAVEDVETSSREFAARVEASYPLALGTDEIEESYPRIGLPVTYIIDADGVVTEVLNGIVSAELLTDLVG
jgi:thiol-disulfide isomerase/thioredoxin